MTESQPGVADKQYQRDAEIRVVAVGERYPYRAEPALAWHWAPISYGAISDALGVHQDTVRRWFSGALAEKERRIPAFTVCYKLAQYLGMTLEQLAWALGTGRSLVKSETGPDPQDQELGRDPGPLQLEKSHQTERPGDRVAPACEAAGPVAGGSRAAVEVQHQETDGNG